MVLHDAEEEWAGKPEFEKLTVHRCEKFPSRFPKTDHQRTASNEK